MGTEIHEEAMAATANNNSSGVSNDYRGIAKGKRTRRQRFQLLVAPAATATPSTSSSGEFYGSAGEEDDEEDMANCLILLAQGRALEDSPPKPGGESDGGKFNSRKLAEAATTTSGKAGFYVYECKTCNKCFPSFQALGGHRASHKKPKPEEKKGIADEYSHSFPIPAASSPKSTFPNHKPRVHECSICGAEFSSGQALGGHMRRHRAAAAAAAGVVSVDQEIKKEKNILCLDLNLPAPSEDERGDLPKSPAFAFSGKQSIVFSASTLVGCHY
ncbi:unnamed protein product [Spirodela intermedia]|uniref:C2H2-type domain-containing protein n=1 Tax=Spirodela intermedia TaxID=51605 RepID=A0A7I8L030_SPIIN|nr:unnamed protein product [Spirodela intermedia]